MEIVMKYNGSRRYPIPKGVNLTCQICGKKIRPSDHRMIIGGKLVHKTTKCVERAEQCLI